MRSMKGLVFIVLIFALALAGCGGVRHPMKEALHGSEEFGSGAAQGGDNTESTPETRTIKHALGETKITGVPKRIVALEWLYAEDVLALGVQPVGIADMKG